MPTYLRVLCGLVALALALVACTVTTTFYSSYGSDALEKGVFVTLAILSLAIKLVAPAAQAHMRGTPRAMLWLGIAAAVTFDCFGTAGYVEMTRGAKVGTNVEDAHDYHDAKAAVDKAAELLAPYQATRGAAEIEADLKSARGEAGKCSPSRAYTDGCKRVAALEAESARSEERDKREAAVNEARDKLKGLKKPNATADPQGAVAAGILKRFGLGDAGAEKFVSAVISFLLFVFFEVVGPALAFAALHGGGGRVVHRQAAVLRDPPARAPRARRNGKTAASPETVHLFLREIAAGARVAPDIRATGRKLYGPQRALGDACGGISGTAMNRILKTLELTGTIALNAGPSGTEIELLK